MNRILIGMLMLALPFCLHSQDFEIGLLFGASAYEGDLTEKNTAFQSQGKHAALGIFGRLDLNRYFSSRLNFTYGKLSGSDALSSDQNRQLRNLSFQSKLVELSLVGELNLLGFTDLGDRLRPYLYGGIALFHFNPEANFDGQLVELQALGTEGQGMENFKDKYNLTQFSIPLGFGISYKLSRSLNIGFDVGLRKTFTDYIDDVSSTYVNYDELVQGNGPLAGALGNRTGELLQTEPVRVATGTQRGNDQREDWYYVAGLTLSYQFYGSSNGLSRPGKHQLGCPKF